MAITNLNAPKKSSGLKWLFYLVIVPVALFALYLWFVLSWSYSRGERAGYVQKLSERGWLCKTWEGEIALVTIPGTVAEKFQFTVRDEAIAKQINAAMGQRATLDYEQHIGIPTNCFGDTEYFVKGVRIVSDVQTPAAAMPMQPAPTAPAPAAPAPTTAAPATEAPPANRP